MKEKVWNSLCFRFGVEGFKVQLKVGEEGEVFGLFFHCP